ncbi:hypothetical protein J4558_09185 [Leptolyngbya sp. 15MV]|nr:hypothetical protein J4558_09185 [Leptolyngbya sp. 15MV]
MKRLVAAALVASAALAASPLIAQEDARDDVRMSIVYGEDAAPPCPQGEICVVARLPEAERYRIPPTLRFSDDPQNTAWTRRVERLEMIGAFGTLSCSPAGLGGFTGCTQQLIQQAYGDRAEGAEVRFSELIAAARAERLATIDESAAAEQARVEQIEREYMERLERERGSELPGETGDAILPSPNAEPIMQTPEG